MARVAITIPEEQKEVWEEEAEEMDMSLSKYGAHMIQAGRRGFDLSEPESSAGDD